MNSYPISKKENRHFLLITTNIILFFFISTKIQVPFSEPIRPFYSIALILFFIIFLYKFIFNQKAKSIFFSGLLQPHIFLLLFFLIYILFFAVIAYLNEPIRQVKDALYFIFWIIIIPLVFIFQVSSKKNFDYVVYIFSKSIVIFAIISSLLAFIIFFDIIDIKISNYEFLQSNFFRKYRIHGLLGEPTAFACLVATGIISLFYIKNYTGRNNYILFIILLFALVFSGSRNALIALILVLFASALFDTDKYSKIIIYLLLLIFGLPFFTTVSSLLGYENKLYEIYISSRYNFDSESRFSRIYTWNYTLNAIGQGNIFEILLGKGAFQLRNDFGSAYNSILEISHDYGLLMSISFILMNFSAFLIGYRKFKKTKIYFYKFGCLLVVLGFSLNLFMSYFPTIWFNFGIFSYIFGLWIISIPIKNKE